MWSLVLASVVLIVSMIANWVQTEVLDTNQFADNTDKILENEDVQEQLSIFAVDELYANVDVKPKSSRGCRARLSRSPLRSRRRRDNSREPWRDARLASSPGPRCHRDRWRAAAIRQPDRGQGQFVSTQGGVVTLEYGSFVADVALAWE